MTLTVDVVESRSDDDTTSCCSTYSSSAPVHASRSESSDDEVRDDDGGGSSSERTPTTAAGDGEEEFIADDESQPYFDACESSSGMTIGTGTGTGTAAATELYVIPEQIPEEVVDAVEPTPSSEESELGSAGSKETETTVDVSYDSITISGGSNSEDVSSGDDDNAITDPTSADCAAVSPEDDDLNAVPSDDAVIATSTEEEDGASAATTPTQSPQDQWKDAMLTLKKNPVLMTADILNLSLTHRAPLHVVSFMLGINPDAAGVPSSGPSSLQVAIRKRCSLDVIECIVRACPYALFDSCGQTYDPLSLAKIYRREEKELIDMLSLPISHWISNDARNAPKSKKSVRFESTPSPSHKNREDPCPPPPPPPPPAPILKPASRMTSEDKRELSNIKLIVAAIVKSQKKLMAETEENHQRTKALAKSEARTRREMAEFVEERMKKVAKSHLIAIEMKERAFASKVDSLGNKMSDMLDEAASRQQKVDREQKERDEKLREAIEGAISTIVTAADRMEKACDLKMADLTMKVDMEVDSLRTRQDLLEDRIDKTSSSGACNTGVFEEPSFDVESIPETTSTDNLFSEDVECGFDETLVKGLYQIESSFSSEWNASTQRLVVDEPVYHSSAAWWRAAGTRDGGSGRRKHRTWRRWFKKLG